MKKLTLLAAFFAATTAHAAEATPQAAVDQFLKFELEGGRLHAESGFEQVHLVEAWQAEAPRCAGARCKVTIRFTYSPTAALGMEQAVPHPDGGSGQVEYTVQQQGGQWQLDAGKEIPHVSRLAMEKMLKEGL
jgi:hypothetical protein